MALKRSIVFAVVAAGLLGSRCGGDGIARPPAEPLQMELTVSAPTGDPSHPVTVRTRVKNVGWTPIYYLRDCVQPGIMRLTDPEQRHVNRLCDGTCPNVACPLCAPMSASLGPGEIYDEEFTFVGELRDCYGTFPGAAGVYRTDAVFMAFVDGGQRNLTKSVSFTWTTGP